MPTTFTVFSLGVLTDIDTTEGNTLAENAGALVGSTFGGLGNALLNNAQTFSPGTTGFAGGTANAYDQNNSPNETFRINGGAEQTFDSSVVYNATITYLDGTTAGITAVIFQDTAGNSYWAPEFSANVDQTAMEAGPIRSLTLDSLNLATFSGMTGDRQAWANFVTCYLRGTKIATAAGERAIETLAVGDRVQTRDHGFQSIRWIGKTTVIATDRLAPVRITKGALGPNVPHLDLYVSRQHRMLLTSKVARRMFGSSEVLIPAIKLTNVPGIDVASLPCLVTYFHLMTNQHDIIYAEGAPSETLFAGQHALTAMGPDAMEELEMLFPDIASTSPNPARLIVPHGKSECLVQRHLKNAYHLAS